MYYIYGLEHVQDPKVIAGINSLISQFSGTLGGLFRFEIDEVNIEAEPYDIDDILFHRIDVRLAMSPKENVIFIPEGMTLDPTQLTVPAKVLTYRPRLDHTASEYEINTLGSFSGSVNHRFRREMEVSGVKLSVSCQLDLEGLAYNASGVASTGMGIGYGI